MAEAVSVTNFTLQRDAAKFILKQGTVCFTPAVNGKVTGAVFVGEGSFHLTPPIPVEQRFLNILTRDNEGIHEDFTELGLRFGDATYDDIKKAASGSGGSCPAGVLNEVTDVYRRKFHYNLAGRLLEDVLSPEPGGFFTAAINGKKYSSKELFVIDPNGVNIFTDGILNDRYQQAIPVAPEEVAFATYDSTKDVIWSAFHFSKEYAEHKTDQLGGGIDIQRQKLTTQIERSGKLDGQARTTFTAQHDGTRVVGFDLWATLRVSKVTDEAGQALSFIQEDKQEDPNFYVILPRALKAGEQLTVETTYSGKDAVSNAGGGTYFPLARTDWFPANPATPFGDYAEYEMQFSIPKGMTMVATGKQVSETVENGQSVSKWVSETPQATAGFNFGKFKKKEQKLDRPAMVVQSFANEELPDMFQAVKELDDVGGGDHSVSGRASSGFALGSLSTVSMMEKPLAEAQLAVQIYTNYFGPVSYSHVAMTPQASCNFGQSWPYLVYLPICAYLDDTQRHQLVGEDLRLEFWKLVGPHEVAHQWWGHTVGFDSYRDQWMSEGFAEFAASLFVEKVYAKNPKMYLDFWRNRRDFMVEKTRMGWRAVDAGPVTMGYRLSNEKFGNELTFRLIYPKGAYILHMLREMMYDNKTGDDHFRAMLQDFTRTYADRIATTEDFKTIVEKHMTQNMDLDGNHTMDWFFNEWVYGTALPRYSFDSSFENQNGNLVMKFKLTQSNVDANFKMRVPIYLEMADGRIARLGEAAMIGNNTLEQSVPFGKVDQPPRRAMINYYYDVLSDK